MIIAEIIFIFIWLLIAILGLIKPRIFLPFVKWNMKILGKMYGFKVELESEEIVNKRIRQGCSFLLIYGLFILFMVLIGRTK